MPDMNSLYAGYREATRGLETQAASERERVNREYDAQRDDLQQQLSGSERDVQRELGRLRTAERREQRRADLPVSRPRDIGTTEKLADVRQQGESIRQSIRETQAKVEQARGESVADLQRQVTEGKGKLREWYREARAAERAANKAAKAAAKAEAQTEKRVVTATAPAKYRAETADPFAGAKAKGSAGTQISPFAGATAQGKAGPAEPFSGAIARGSATQAYNVLSDKQLAKEMSLSLIPIYGTVRYAKQAAEGGYSAKEKAFIVLSVVGDVAIMVPAVKGVTTAIRSGATLSSVLSKTALKKLVTGLVTDEKSGTMTVTGIRPTTKEMRQFVTKVWRDERGAVAVANKVKPTLQASLIRELDDIVNTATKRGVRASTTVKFTAAKRVINKIPAATQRAAKVRQAAAKTRALNSLANYQKATMAGKAINAAQAQATVNAVAATGNVAATREVIAAIATQIATQASARGMTMPQIRQATQAAIEQMTMTSAQSATATGTWIEAQQATGTAARAATRTRATTATAAQVNIKAGVQPQARIGTSLAPDTELAPSVKPQPATKQQAATLTDIAVKTQPKAQAAATERGVTTTARASAKTLPQTRTRASTRGTVSKQTSGKSEGESNKYRRLRLNLPDGGSVVLTQQQYAGIVAWRQGLFYILVYPPYGKAQTIYTRKPVPGIYYARGPQSPQKSAAVVGGGKLPRSFEVAMGIAKVRVTPGAKARPQLTFRSVKVTPELGVIRRSKRHG